MPFNIGPMDLIFLLVITLVAFGLVVAALRLGLRDSLRSRQKTDERRDASP